MAEAALDLDENTPVDPRISEAQETEDAIFAEAEEEEDVGAMPTGEDQEIRPSFGSESWHEYVMRQFHDNELINGAPTCDGCRRVFEQLVGVITDTTIPSYIGPNRDNNGTATVVLSIEALITDTTHPANGRIIRVQEIADVNSKNTDEPYSRYPSATAATRAEGRALRKLLRLRGITTAEETSKAAEEETDGNEWEPDEPITDSQINLIDMLCGTARLNMSVTTFINSGRKTYTNIHEVTKTTAQRMIQELNKIQKNQKPKPPGIAAYVPNWNTPK